MKCVRLTFADTFGPEYYLVSDELSDKDACARARELYKRDVEKFPLPIPRTIVVSAILPCTRAHEVAS